MISLFEEQISAPTRIESAGNVARYWSGALAALGMVATGLLF